MERGAFMQQICREGEAIAEDNLIGVLQKCRQTKDIYLARRLTGYFQQHQLQSDPSLGNHLVPTLAECGFLSDAHRFFDSLPHRTEHSWTSLISGYIKSGDSQLAFHLYDKMQQDDSVQPNIYTYLALLNACARLKDVEKGPALHSEIVKRGHEGHVFNGSAVVGNTLVDMYGKCGWLAEGRCVLDRLPVRNAVSWAALIAAYADHGLVNEAGICYQQMQLDGILPDAVTFLCSIKACGSVRALETGHAIYAETTKRGLERELRLGSAFVDMYAKCGLVSEAQHVFDSLSIKDVVAWAALIAGYAEHKLDAEVLCCFKKMQLEGISPDLVTFVCSLKACGNVIALGAGQEIHAEITKKGLERDLYVGSTLLDMYCRCGLLAEAQHAFSILEVHDAVSWNALITGYAEHRLGEKVLNCVKQMQLEGISPDYVTYVCSFKACGIIGGLETGQELHSDIVKRGLEGEIELGNTLVNMYTECGFIVDGRKVFDNISVRSVVTWTAIIKAYGENHESDMALKCFEEMQEQGVKPDSVTFTSLLVVCSQGSLVLKGQELFKAMMEEHHIKPTLDHHVCMVDLLARAGYIDEAQKYIRNIQCSPSSVIISALLTGCKIYGILELGQRCFQQLIEANEADSSAYLLMADIYASAGRWTDANKTEQMRACARANKTPGNAFIEVNKSFYDFPVGAKISNDVSDTLVLLRLHMKNKDYVPNVHYISSSVYNERTLYNDSVQ